MNNSNNNTIQEILDEAAIKGELEELDPNIHFTYEPLAKIIGDETLRKIFSKHVLWKEEGLTEFIESLGKIFTDRDTASINSLINLILKLVYNLTCEKHPVVVVKAIDIFEKLLILIRDSKVELNYDFSISDLILVKIKEKVGDVSPKVRGRVVNLYCFMLKQQSCDYNNLLTELVEDELKPLIDTKRIVKSSKMKLGKLSIFDNVFDDFPNAIKQNRTSMQYFPFEFILRYVIENLNHSKSEVRKLDRAVLIKMYKLFGFKMLEPLLKKADERELAKLVPDIPELEEVIKSSNSLVNNSVTLTKKAVTNTSRQKSNERKRNSPSPVKMVMCNYCQKQIEKSIELQDHLNKDCLMFTQCVKCKNNMEVKTLNHHLLNQCKNKDEFKMCKRCKEPIDDKEYALHVKENKCNPAKNINSSNRCPLCHKDILPGDKGFYQHLVKDICQKNKRREKVNFLKK